MPPAPRSRARRSRTPRARPSAFAHACAALAAGFLLAFFFWPLGVILQRSLGGTDALVELASNPFYWQRLGFTLFQALLSTLLTVALALPAAVLFARYRFAGKGLLRSALTVPFVMPTVVAAIGFLALVGPRGLLGVDLRGTLALVLLAHVFYNTAVVVRLVGGFLEAAAPRLEEAAATLGAGPWRALWRVTLPLAAPALLAAATLVFVFCFTSFGVIVILAPDPQLATLEVLVYRLTARLLQLDAAALLALAQLALVMLATVVYTRLQARLAVPLGGAPKLLPRPGGRARLALAAAFAPLALLTLAPLAALAWQALAHLAAGPGVVANLEALFAPSGTVGVAGAGRALRNSLAFAGASATLGVGVGFCFAYAVARGNHRWLDAASLLPLATSAVTLGLGYLLAFPRLTASAWGVVLAHTLVGFPFVARALLPALRGVPRSLRWAAATLGAGAARTWWRVELPLISPSLVAAASFAFAVSMGEFGATLVIQRPEHATLPVAIFQRLGRPGEANYGAALALALLLMLVTAATMLLLERFGEGEF